MIKKYVFGKPFNTESILADIPAETATCPYFEYNANTFNITLGKDTAVFGLGENLHGINKRSERYVSNCSDEPIHSEDRLSLYAAHNFAVINHNSPFGVFFDASGVVEYDIGYTKADIMSVSVPDGNVAVYIITGNSIKDIVREFRRAAGQSYIPPLWAFGYQQSRWSYYNEGEVTEVVNKHRQNNIPLDAVYLDIDYMDGYKDFTINNTAFPDFPEFVKKMREQHIHLVPIIDAGVKIEKGYSVYEEGVEKGYFCKDKDGNAFAAVVWPGETHFPDVLNKDARRWFGENYKKLLDMGIDGFWNDMNEPSIFYTMNRLKDGLKNVKQICDKNEFTDGDRWAIASLTATLPNNPEDYKSFYHNVDGEMIPHNKAHNLFGYNMTRAASESFDRNSDKRILMFSRSSCVGMHRYGGIWTGDNTSWWSHLALNLHMLPSLNMCGFLYCGADLGGFSGNTSRELLMRWLELGIFTPLMRNHSANGTRNQEVYNFENIKDFANVISIRYALIPYIYSEFVKAALNGDMLFRPLCFDYADDSYARDIEDQLMLGEGLMIAPVISENARSRYVYCPENMLLVRMRSASDYECEPISAGHHRIHIELNEVVFFIRPGHILPLAESAASTADQNRKSLTLLGIFNDSTEYTLYSDDGYTKDVSPDRYITLFVNDGTPSASENDYILKIAKNG